MELKMFVGTADHCSHQLVFAASLDHAATCARCGAIALIETRGAHDSAAHIRWIPVARHTHTSTAALDARTNA